MNENTNPKKSEAENKRLSVLLPVRSNGNIDVAERLKWRTRYTGLGQSVEFIAVDDGSDNGDKIKSVCKDLGFKYVRLETADAPFSLSRARNAGIRAAAGDYVYFEDLDFIHETTFYNRIVELIKSDFFKKTPLNFLAVPTLFLTRGASEKLMAAPNFDVVFREYTSRLALTNPDEPNDLCDSYAPVGSNILLKRETCFQVGMFDEYFNSWGGEDREFVFRLLYHNSKLLRPLQMHVTKSWKLHRTSAFEGWRSLYRLHGEAMAAMGLYAAHIHHEENPWKDKFSREQNFRYCNDKIAAIGAAGRVHITPEPTSEQDINIFLGRNIIFNNDEVIGTIGNVEICQMDESAEPDLFAEKLADRRPNSVFFQNPYGKPWMKQVWDALKSRGVRCICAERGAFPGSIYFDDDFCAESQSYDKAYWENSDPIDTYAFIAGLRASNNALEPQGEGDFDKLRRTVHPQDKRNVLVILQSLTDATTLHFCGHLSNYNSFLSAIRSLSENPGINLLIKNHPLNKVNPLEGVGIDVSDLNIYDLFSVADSAITLNSGAGLLALGAGVPVIAMGQCFYAQEGLAIACSDVERVEKMITSNLFVDKSSVGRFYGYLIREFYSFGDWLYGSRSQSANTNMSLMSRLVYTSVKISGFPEGELRPRMSFSDLIMAPYLLHIFQNKDSFKAESRGSAVKKMLATVVDLNEEPDLSGEYLEEAAEAERAAEMFYKGFAVEAAEKFERLACKSSKANHYRASAEAYVACGHTEKAVALYRTALELVPGHRRVLARLRELELRDNKDPWMSTNGYRIARPRRLLR